MHAGGTKVNRMNMEGKKKTKSQMGRDRKDKKKKER